MSAHAATPLPIPHFKRGINLARLQSFASRDPAKPGAYLWPPFQGGMARMSDSEIRRLRALGFDFVRLPVDAGPFLAASEPDRRLLLDDLRALVLRLLKGDLTVMVDIHPATYASVWRPEDILRDPSGPAFAAYQSLLFDVARRIKDLPTTQVALELMNEPQPKCVRENGEDWTISQKRLYSAVRTIAPDLPIVLTGGCWSSINGLATLDADGYDSRTLFDVHFYEPHFFTHQSQPWTSPPTRYLAGLSYPWTNGSVELAERLTEEHLRQQAKTSTPPPEEALAMARDYISSYYRSTKPDLTMIEKRFAEIADWAKEHDISADRIVIGEFGAVRRPAYIPDDGSRVAWYRDVRLTTEKDGFGWAVWDDHVNFGLMTGDGNGAFDMDVAKALGLDIPVPDQ
ncbi:glycosyl hydrolase family 5 [Ciceribacter naphthalenivorans]|uniref:Glycosyl hydrolase family 5 n=3 Tax=Pseudomonadota TaxID=1224 RepID=A0A512HIH3_9HYPH|nr:glycosyl hydrolase family 5 [Ciceribacter naphthalenivorans]GLR20896.1 glycosyl hydrolase family 5 [Ciceribacter naphthalenivorans]GLT03752.1 glycosyl hydrolase family 5 [Sphingomonas psychrolutea]